MKRFLATAFVVLLFGVYFSEAKASYPDKPIKVIIGYEAGSSGDMVARALYPLMEKELGKPFLILNKPGAASSLAMREVMEAKPDGYTLGMSFSIHTLKTQGLLPYTHRNFDVLSIPARAGAMLAVPIKSPIQSVKELVDYAKANPGKMRMSTTQKGGNHWIQALQFERVTGTKFVLIVNPGGGSYIALQLAGNHADVGIVSFSALFSQFDAGNVRILATTGSERMRGYEKIQTLKELGYDMVSATGVIILGPKKLPQEIYERLTSIFAKVTGSQEWVNWCTSRFNTPTPNLVGEEAAKFLDWDAEEQRPILETLKIK
jgi:tripartite-type tricarboxylate transporter receptor subunit TctC